MTNNIVLESWAGTIEIVLKAEYLTLAERGLVELAAEVNRLTDDRAAAQDQVASLRQELGDMTTAARSARELADSEGTTNRCLCRDLAAAQERITELSDESVKQTLTLSSARECIVEQTKAISAAGVALASLLSEFQALRAELDRTEAEIAQTHELLDKNNVPPFLYNLGRRAKALVEWMHRYAQVSQAAHRAMDAFGVPWTDDVIERLKWLGAKTTRTEERGAEMADSVHLRMQQGDTSYECRIRPWLCDPVVFRPITEATFQSGMVVATVPFDNDETIYVLMREEVFHVTP